ncbi:MAG TPA: hypothetical protein V6D22_17750 [Candidatus Obscuribacterales bacterium]
MPLVFVHGVNVRQGPVYERELAFRNRHFIDIFYKQLGLNVDASSIFSPYWGDLGATLSPELPFLPKGSYQLLWRKHGQKSNQIENDEAAAIEDGVDPDSPTPLLDMAKTASIADVVDILCELTEREMLESGQESEYSSRRMAGMAERALNFAHSAEGQAWLDSLTSDDQLLERLTKLLHSESPEPDKSSQVAQRLSEIIKSAGAKLQNRLTQSRQKFASESGSLRSRINEDFSNARFRMREKVVTTTARLFNEPLRAIFHEQCALLIGDAFAYFSSRGDSDKPAPIAQRVIDSLREASALAQKSGQPLIVIGHSMGGVILCDVVTCYGKDIAIDSLITVGSQFPLFTDLGMFPGVHDSPRPIARPSNVSHWINIFDPHDFLGYPASHLFAGIEDFHLPTYAVGASAHADYFNRRSFYFHLARRMQEYMPVAKST